MPFFIPTQMGLIDQIKQDVRDITSNTNDFAVTINLTAPTGETVQVAGTHKKIHLGVDPETGKPFDALTASVSISEGVLTDLKYPVRNEKREVIMKKTLVDVKDSTGLVCNYIIKQTIPDETVGLIVCILDCYE